MTESDATWNTVLERLTITAFHKDVKIMKGEVGIPSKAGFTRSIFGEIKGQIADWRKVFPDGTCVHVVEFDTYYSVHRDIKNPDTDPAGHLWHDAPHWLFLLMVLSVVAVIAFVLYLKGKKKTTPTYVQSSNLQTS